MNKKLSLLLLLFLLSVYNYAEEIVHIPQIERLRPLSFPGKAGSFAIGIEGAFDFRYDSLFLIGTSLSEFQFTHILLGDAVTFNLLPPVITWHLLKNTVTTKENEYRITEPNLALAVGFFGAGFSYSEINGSEVRLDYGVRYRWKSLFGDKQWIYSDGRCLMDLKKQLTTELLLGTGYQVSDMVSVMTSVDVEWYEYAFDYYDYGFTTTYIRTVVKIPIDIKVNAIRNTAFMFRMGYSYLMSTRDNTWLQGMLFGFQYSSYR